MSVSTINGTARSDKINGTNISETINGEGGSDFINAGGGDDTIIYDGSDKRISGDAGNDMLLLNGTAQQLNLNNQAIQGIESLQLEGSGRHAITLRASDIVRVSDTDILRIKGTAGGLLNSTLNIGTGWTFVSTDGQTQTLRNGQATLIVDLPLVISGVSNNATINTAAGADTSVTEDEGSGLAARPLQATGKLLVDDTNAGQGVLLGAPVAVGTPLGTLTLTLVTADSATAAGVYDYIYSVGNDKLQSLRQGTSVVDSFVVRTVDGTTRTLSFTINGADDAAVIGTPANNTVTEDQNVNSASRLTASGALAISDPDTGDTPAFVALNQVAATSGAKLGTLTLGTSGAYTYNVSNAAVQSLGSGKTATDTFTVTSADGTTKDISFTINGANDAAVIGDPTGSSVTEDQTANGDPLLKAEGSISISDADSEQEWFQTSVVSAEGNLGSLALQADGNYVYSVSNALVQSLAGGPPKVDTFTVASVDGITKTISFAINGVDDPAVIGNPSNFGGTHDPEKPADYVLSTTGKFNIVDPDSPGLSFLEQSFYFENYGNLSVGTDGAYYYETYNFVLKTLGGPSMPSVADEFTLTLSDGSKHKVYFNLFGVNDAAVIGNPSVSSVTEDKNVDEANQLTATGTLGIYDPDTGDVPAFLELNQAAATGGAKYGTLTLAANGAYTYSVSNDAVQSLGSGKFATDTFTVTAADGTTKDISFTINGADDAAVVTATNSIVTEDTNVAMNNVIYTRGTFIVSDVDIGDPLPIIKGFPYFNDNTYGLLSYSSREGIYDYQVTNSKLQFLGAGETVTDTFTVTSLDGTFTTDIRITLVGVNDVANIGDPTNNTVTEDVNVQNGFLRAVGTISISDLDSGQSSFNTAVTGSPNNLGTLVLEKNGSYTYQVSNTAVQYLGGGKKAIDSFTIQSVDGTQKEISFIINGVNDDPVVQPSDKTVTATIFERDAAALNANSQTIETVSGSFFVYDADEGDTLKSITGSEIINGTYGTLTFTVSKSLPNSLTSRVDWTYSYSDRDLNLLPANAKIFENFFVQLIDDSSARALQQIVITLNGADEKFDARAESYVITEALYNTPDEGTKTHVVTGTLNTTDIGRYVDWFEAPSNQLYLGNFKVIANDTTKTIDWTFEMNDRYIDYLMNQEVVRQKFYIDVQQTNGSYTTKEISFDLTGGFDLRSKFIAGDRSLSENIFGAEPYQVVRGFGGNDSIFVGGSISNKIYGDPGNDTITNYTFNNDSLVRGGDGDDVLTVAWIGDFGETFTGRSVSEIFGDKGNDTFNLPAPEAPQSYWGGPGSDTYVVAQPRTINYNVFVPKIWDFDITSVSQGGDVVKISTAGLTQEDIANTTVRASSNGNSWVLDINGYVALEFIGSNYKASDFIGHYEFL